MQPPKLNMMMEGNVITLYWNAEGFVLQESTDVESPQNWKDIPGPVTTSPYSVTNGTATFYRLRN